MKKNKLTMDTWIWAIIQNPEKDESFLGQEDKETQVRFIPVFYDKDSSLMCLNMFAKDNSLTYESQAVMYEDLINYAKTNNFLIFFLDGQGKIVEQIDPYTV